MADPVGDERVWYRHVREGNRGFMVERNGRQCIKLDRPNEEIVLPYREHEWQLDRESRPLNKHQAGRVAYEADLAARIALGDHAPRKDWLSLTDEQRIVWMAKGPPAGPRAELFRLIMKWSNKYVVK